MARRTRNYAEALRRAQSGGVAKQIGILQNQILDVTTSDPFPVTRRQWRQPARVISTFEAGHGWTGGTGDVTLTQGPSYQAITNNAGGSLYLSSPTFAATDMSGEYIRLRGKISDPSKLQTFQCYVTCGAGNTLTAGVPGDRIANEIFDIAIPRSMFTVAAGTANWANVTQIQFRFQDKSTGAVTINLLRVDTARDLHETWPGGALIVAMDDGFPGQWTYGKPVFDSLNIPVSHYIIDERYMSGGASGKTAADLRAARDSKGWAICSHAHQQAIHDYRANGFIPADVAEADWRAQRRWIRDNVDNDGVDDFAYNPGTGQIVDQTSDVYNGIRRTFATARTFAGNGYQESIEPTMPYRLRTVGFTGQTNAQLMTNIDQAAGAGAALMLVYHDIISGSVNGTSNSLPAPGDANLNTVLTYALSKGLTPITMPTWRKVAATS